MTVTCGMSFKLNSSRLYTIRSSGILDLCVISKERETRKITKSFCFLRGILIRLYFFFSLRDYR